MKTKLERELMRAGKGNGSAWDGLLTMLAKAATKKANPWWARLRVKFAIIILPKG